MRREGMTVREATGEWVREFNSIPQRMIAVLMEAGPDEWYEVTCPCVGDRVYVYDVPSGSEHCGEIDAFNEMSDLYRIRLDNGKMVLAEEDEFEVERDDGLPMWGTMWSFGDSCDNWWLEEDDGIAIMSRCGFRIYQHEEFGYFFGIDGAGYDFFDDHWCPLYRARGLQWHDPETEKEAG